MSKPVYQSLILLPKITLPRWHCRTAPSACVVTPWNQRKQELKILRDMKSFEKTDLAAMSVTSYSSLSVLLLISLSRLHMLVINT